VQDNTDMSKAVMILALTWSLMQAIEVWIDQTGLAEKTAPIAQMLRHSFAR
jgi:hypothetical protein